MSTLRHSQRLRPILGSVALACAVSLTGCSAEDDSAKDANPSAAPAGETVACEYPADGSQASRPVEAPAEQASPEAPTQASVSTSAGDFEVTLTPQSAPCTVHNFVSLAEQGWFDDTECHRLTTEGIYVLQCGDPTATGTGGPGYTIPDELSGSEAYAAGTLAMANTGMADSGGSQFFVVYADTDLPPSYTVFGTLDEAGIAVMAGIADKGTADGAPDGEPADPVTIMSVSVG